MCVAADLSGWSSDDIGDFQFLIAVPCQFSDSSIVSQNARCPNSVDKLYPWLIDTHVVVVSFPATVFPLRSHYSPNARHVVVPPPPSSNHPHLLVASNTT